MSQIHGTRTTDNSRRAGSIPGLSATRRTGLPRTPVQPLSTFGTSTRPSNIFRTSGEAPASLSPSISTRISAFDNPVDDTHGGPEESKTPTSPLDYAPPDGPPDPPGGGDGDGDEPDPNPDPEPDNPDPRTPPGSPDMLNQFLGGLRQLAHSITANQRPPPAPRPEKVKVRDPDTFNGSDPRKLRSFLVACNLHFRDRPYAFPDDEKKILFVLSYLDGPAMSWFEPGLMDPTNSAHWMWNFEVFINELEVNFGPHDPVGDAESSLTNLTMGEDSRIVKYNVEFWKLVARLDWNESALTARYFSGLPLRIRVEILRGGKPTTLAAMRLKAQDADDIYWIGKDEAKRESRKSSNSGKKEANSTTHHSNTNASTSKPTQSSNHGKPAQSGKKPDAKDKPKGPDLSDKLGKDGKLRGDKRERRIKEGLCLYCGKPGHVAADCNKAAAAKARASKVEPTESAVSKK
jgi:hypothetical protein